MGSKIMDALKLVKADIAVPDLCRDLGEQRDSHY